MESRLLHGAARALHSAPRNDLSRGLLVWHPNFGGWTESQYLIALGNFDGSGKDVVWLLGLVVKL